MHMTLRSKRACPLREKHASTRNKRSTVNINDLPSEMLLEVMSYLDQDQLRQTVPKVCTLWNALHSDPTLYRRLTFSFDEPPTDVVLKLLSEATFLKHLELNSRTDTNKILQRVKTENLQLETLILRDCDGSTFSEAVSTVGMLGVLENCNMLRHLSFEGSYCQGTNVYNEIGLCLPSLRSVDFGKPRRFNCQALLNISDNCRQLEEIKAYDQDGYNVYEYQITDHVVSSLCNQSKYLKHVKIDLYSCSDAAMFSLATCQQLTTLELHNAIGVTDIGIMAISGMPQVVNFGMWNNDEITTHGWLTFFQKPIMRRLRKLNLYMCKNVNQEGVNIIVTNPYELQEYRIVNDDVCAIQ